MCAASLESILAMHVNALIDAVVRQTTVLIAQLATAAGVRAPLAHLANQVFLDLVTELEAQGLGRKVVADMFGMALRSYQLKVRRLSESVTERNRTLWEATLGYIRQNGPVTQTRLMERFARDDEQLVRAVIHDLVESGFVYRTGRGNSKAFRAADPAEMEVAFQPDDPESEVLFVWILVYRRGPVAYDTLLLESRLTDERLKAVLATLEGDGRVERVDGDPVRWRCSACFLPAGTTVGWGAALFDHYQSVVNALCIKLRSGQTRSLPGDALGGSTWSFDVWPGHPKEAEVLGLLRELRHRVSQLRTEVTAYNEAHGRPDDANKVIFYVGQAVVLGHEDEGER